MIEAATDGPITDPFDIRILLVEAENRYRKIGYEAVGRDNQTHNDLPRGRRITEAWDADPADRYRGAIQCPNCPDFVEFRAEKLVEIVSKLVAAGVDRLPLDRLPSLLHQVSGD